MFDTEDIDLEKSICTQNGLREGDLSLSVKRVFRADLFERRVFRGECTGQVSPGVKPPGQRSCRGGYESTGCH